MSQNNMFAKFFFNMVCPLIECFLSFFIIKWHSDILIVTFKILYVDVKLIFAYSVCKIQHFT